MTSSASVGQPIRRVEDDRLVTGRGSYVADISREGQLYARFVRSQAAHGRIVGVDLDAAREHPGIAAAFSAADMPDLMKFRIPLRMEAPPGTIIDEAATQAVLASDVVRFVGEPVAVVVAADPYTAEDACELVWVDLEELPALTSVDESLESAAIHPDAVKGNDVGGMSFAAGDGLDEVFATADLVVKERLHTHRHAAVPMETRGLVADYREGKLTVWGPTKVKHYNRRIIADALGVEEDSIRFIEPDVGGAFGARGELYPEDLVVPWLAMRLGRPVKWVEDRSESLVAMNQSREQIYDIEVAAGNDGTLLGLRSRNTCDNGAYLRTNGVVPPWIGALNLAGPYQWSAFESVARLVTTNKTPLGTFRGPGEVESTYARERMIDLIAQRLGIDPADMRLHNLIPKERLPYTIEVTNAGPPMTFESGDYHAQFSALLDHVDYPALKQRVRETALSDNPVGVGLSCTFSESGHGAYECARVVVEPDGHVIGFVGTSGVGQGVRTSLAQVLADALDVPFEQVEIRYDDTETVPDGGGAFGDRGTIFGAGAIHLAVTDLREQVIATACARDGVGRDEVDVIGLEVRRRADGAVMAHLKELGCEGNGRFTKTTPVDYAFQAAVAVVSVNRPTGRVTIERYVGAYDVGRMVNPLLLRGQLEGAAAQGLGGVLLEECAYDSNGQPLSGSFMDYLLPTCKEMPSIESIVFEYASGNPLGVKGGGNAGIVATHAAVANAVANALGDAGIGLTRLPVRANAVRTLIRNFEMGARG